MKYYELAYLISSDLDESEAEALSNKIAGFVTELTGVIKINPKIERKVLGYSINKKPEAFLVSFCFSLETSKIADLKKKIEEEKSILRYLLTSKREEEKAPEKIERKENKEQKVDFEKIDEKIDEILQ